MKRIRRQICSILLCATVLLGLWVPGVSALEADTPENQIGNHFAADDETGELPDVPELAGETSKSYADGWIKTDKTIAAGERENEFQITLDVRTKAEIRNVELSEDAAVVIVLDLSGSMQEENRLETAKRAAVAFLNRFAETETADARRKIAVVGFSGQPSQGGWWGGRAGITAATTYQSWTDAADPSTEAKINGMRAEGGTCLQAGLILAKNLLDSDAVADISSKHIVVLTDGRPTYYLTDAAAEDTSTQAIGAPETILGRGSDTDHNTHTKTEDTAWAILATGVNVYGVFLGNDSVNCNNRGCNLRKTGAAWLRENCGFITYAVENTGDLSNIFEGISELIELQAKAWIAEDPLGELFDFAGFVKAPADENAYFYNAADRKIQWNLRLSTPDETTEDGFSIYRLTYTVRLNTLAPGYTANRYYPTNGITSVTWLIEKSTESGVSEIDNGNAYFNVPSAKGYAADISFRKTDETGQPLAGAKFGLYHGETLLAVAVSGDDGTVLFEAVPSGHSYTILEESAPEGFLASTESYPVEVAYGNLIGTIGEENTVINVPAKSYGGLTVSKTVSGAGANPEDEFTFTVTLDDTGITGTYGDLTFTDGVSVFVLKDGERVTASGLPAGTGYTVTESESKGYAVTVNGESTDSVTGTVETDTLAEIAFDNYKAEDPVPPTIDIAITKTVLATGDRIPAWENTFGFVVSKKLPEETGEADVLAAPRITLVGTGTDSVAHGFDDLDFAGNDTVTFYVWEAPGYETFWKYDDTVYRVTFTKNPETGDVSRAYEKIVGNDDGTSFEPVDELTFTNVYHYEDQPIIGTNGGDLTISKTVSRGDREKAFPFTVTLDDPDVNGAYGDMVFTDGVAVVYLKDGESATAEELPADVGYTVREGDNDGYTVTVNGTDSAIAEGNIIENETVFAAFDNAKDIEPLPETGSLTVEKYIHDDDRDTVDKAFTFAVTLTQADDTVLNGEELPAVKYGKNGAEEEAFRLDWEKTADGKSLTAAFPLKHGEKVVINGIPYGTAYKVAETDTAGYHLEHVADNPDDKPGEDGRYLVVDRTDNSVNGIVTKDDEAYRFFSNAKPPVMPVTGDFGVWIFYTLGAVSLLISFVAFAGLLKKTRRSYRAKKTP